MSDRWEPIVTFIVPGRPKPKGRPRFTKRGHAYTPQSTRDAEKQVVDLFELAAPLWEPTLEDVRLTLDVCFQHGRVADLDNVAKLISDALNGWAWVDDRQIRKLEVNGFENAGDRAGVVVSFAIYKGES
ncbi:RusA family crossover junction endodeoxyribonuclease [Agromyces cerinus]|uniref:Holliday junction resolvase RusA (Prophage-encoded endonuclease) n=1 Tax=Agromyces cerinus subsp. cerinus TaxID=232089 RepID=A0A1N6DP46_9MICO|nr:RusA family crossover junction endodeoxyribonuclease [Agromyces cerinus]SIN72555.1 Holliday junction resolvase RusA (prophage-encoded endonuclease) [Agromyces cerinus subsp. cerinus]